MTRETDVSAEMVVDWRMDKRLRVRCVVGGSGGWKGKNVGKHNYCVIGYSCHDVGYVGYLMNNVVIRLYEPLSLIHI